MSRQLAQIRAALAAGQQLQQRLTGDRRAVVACLIRRAAGAKDTEVEAAVAPTGALDVFFILRAGLRRRQSGSAVGSGETEKEKNRGAARWANQVGFPGGHVEGSETDHAAVARECREEVGMDLDRPGGYRFLGSVRERLIQHGTGSSLVVACRVYEQLAEDTQPGPLQAGEVAACGWVPLERLLEQDCARPLKWSAHQGPKGAPWDGYPSVDLPVQDFRIADTRTEEDAARRGFVLWGLTLGIVNDFLLGTELRSAPIALQPRADREPSASSVAAKPQGGAGGNPTSRL